MISSNKKDQLINEQRKKLQESIDIHKFSKITDIILKYKVIENTTEIT